jgi:DNA-binding GntR family transcriptional regulator
VQVARELGVSRTVLREALRMLQREGLVHAQPNRLVRVSDLSLADMEALYVARVTLEAAAIRVSVPLMGTDRLAELEGEIARMAYFAELEDFDRWEEPHRRFHAGLVAPSGERLARMLQELTDHAARYRRFYTVTQTPGGWAQGIREHRAILDAVKAREADAAAAALAVHLSHTVFGVIERIGGRHEPYALRATLEAMGIDAATVEAGATRAA